jgi:uncharacterized membrane protein/protein-disulfide isomerase
MTSTARKWLLMFATLGLGSSSVSSYVHYRLLTDVSYTSFCDVNATMSCAQAYLSRYGSFLGIPVAIGGVLFFALVLVIVGVAGRMGSAARENAPAYVFALSTVALAFVLYLAWASYVVLGNFCILCTITYVAAIGIFVISGGATSFPMKTLPGRAQRDIRTLVSTPGPLMVALLFVAGAVTAIAAFPRESGSSGQSASAATATALPPVSDDDRAKLAQWWEVQPKVEVPVPSDGAKVVIVKFNDYQCPACRMTHDAYKPVLAKYAASGQVKYVLKHYPLEAECNPHAPSNHYASCEAAAAVIMARSKGTAAKLEDWIFAHIGPPPLTGDQVKDAARTVGGITDFDAQYARAKEEIKTDAGLGQLLGVNSTPTFYINNRKLPSNSILAPQYLDVLIQLELQKTK